MSTNWMFSDGCEYTCTHWWYDSEDNDYEIGAIWKFERGFDIPDSWHLIDVDFDARALANTHQGVDTAEIWRWVESQGPDEIDLKEVDY